MEVEQENQQQVPGFEDCLKLLRGERDEQRLAGLLLVTKLCNKDDHDSIRKAYEAVGTRFLDRLLQTGMAKGNTASGENENRDAYLQLSISVLAAFSRVPEIAASADMVSKIPSVLQVMEKEPASSLLEDCYELLLLISSASERGVATFFECGGLKLLATHLSSFPDGSRLLDLSMRLVMLVLGKISLDDIVSRYLTELSILVACVGRQFALLQDAMKFDVLQLLCAVLSSNHSVPLHNALLAMSNDKWPAYIRAGVVDILQNRVAPDQKLQALIVAESMISILGEHWLTSQMDLPDLQISFPSDRCLLLVLESARVEIAVVLNEVAYIKYEAPSSKAEELTLKRRNLAIAFSLVERIIKLISNLSEGEALGSIISEGSFLKVISGLDETVGVVLEYLKDAKDHGQKKGDDLLACVRLVGSYLAEAPLACKEKVKELLGYLLSIEGEDESSPFLSVSFLLPMLCQITMNIEGVKILTFCGGYKAVVKCLLQLVSADPNALEDGGRIYLACDIVMNILLKREHIKVQLDESVFVDLLKALVYWADRARDSSTIMMASCICSLTFDITSEEALLRYPEFGMSTYQKLCHLIVRSLALYGQEMCDDSKSDSDLHQIIAGGYSRWADRFPLLRRMVEQ